MKLTTSGEEIRHHHPKPDKMSLSVQAAISLADKTFLERYRLLLDTAVVTSVEVKDMKIELKSMAAVIKKCINKKGASKEVREMLEQVYTVM